jgi:predicted peptidase
VGEVEQHLRVDTRRRVVMGYSMGGRGTWHLAAKFRSRFVAAIPITGTPGEIELDTLRDLPLYVMHSKVDRRVPIAGAAKAVERLQAMRAPSRLPDCPAGITLTTTWSLPNCAPRSVPGWRPCGSTHEDASSHPGRWAAHGA